MAGAVHLSRKIVNDAFSGHETTGTTYTSRLLLTICFVDWLEGDLAGVGQWRHPMDGEGATQQWFMALTGAHHDELPRLGFAGDVRGLQPKEIDVGSDLAV